MFNPDKKFGAFLLTAFVLIAGSGIGFQLLDLPSETAVPVYAQAQTAPPAAETDYITSAQTVSPNEESSAKFPLDLNAATAEELDLLDGIGPVLAQRIADYRNSGNIFTRIEDIQNVSGIGPGIFQQIKDFIYVKPGLESSSVPEQTSSPAASAYETSSVTTYKPAQKPSETTAEKGTEASASSLSVVFPIEINSATAEEWMALPGIGETLAGRIIQYREEVSAFYSVDELMEVNGIGTVLFNKIKDKIYADTSRLPPLVSGTDDIRTQEIPAVNLNAATAEELQLLPNITPQLAANIISYRDGISGGHLDSIYEVMSAEGITSAIFSGIMDYITVYE